MKDAQFSNTSNTGVMRYYTSSMPPDMPPLASKIPSMYEVEIVEESYIPPRYEVWEEWGCVIIDEDPTGKYSPGEKVCPVTKPNCEDCGSGFLDVVGAAFDYIAGLIEDAKEAIAREIMEVIPGCSESAACRDVIEKGIDYGVSAVTGLPPTMPNFDAFVAQSVGDYIVGELSGIGGVGVEYVCGDTCRDLIAAQIQPYIEQAKSNYNQPWCSVGGGRYGKFSECFAPPIKVHPAPGAADYPGYVSIRVTRKMTPESEFATIEEGRQVRLRVSVEGENLARIGFFGHDHRYMDNIPQSQLPDPERPNSLANFDYTYLGDEPMREALYEEIQVPIPWLAPGESIEIPISLKQFKWENNKGIQTAHSQYLFYRGTSHMTASEYCYSSDSSWEWVPCTNGGSDTWEFTNPENP
jgi:hypothetical protein